MRVALDLRLTALEKLFGQGRVGWGDIEPPVSRQAEVSALVTDLLWKVGSEVRGLARPLIGFKRAPVSHAASLPYRKCISAKSHQPPYLMRLSG
jgi:hypothetical protein